MTHAARSVVAAMLALAVALPAFGGIAGATAADARSGRRLPPPERDDLVRIFDPMMEDLGLRTTRALLQDLDTYEQDPRGRHLAVYVEPIDGTYTDEEYVENFVELAQVYLPMVFKRWKGLKSFDVCVEPTDDPSEAPPSRTQLLVSRRGAKEVRWRSTDLTEVLRVADAYREPDKDPHEFTAYFDATLAEVPALQQARDAAEAATGSDS